MKLQKVSILIFIFFLLLFLLLISIFFSTVLLASYNDLEEQYLTKDLDRVENQIKEELFTLSSTASDWGLWNDTVEFVMGNNSNYVSANLEPDSFDTLNLNIMAFTNSTGNIIYSGSYDMQNKKMVPVPAFFSKQIDIRNPLINISDPHETTKGILMLPENPLLVVSQPIMYSDYSGPVQGVIIIGKYINKDIITKFGDISYPNLTFIRIDDPLMLPDLTSSIQKNEDSEGHFVQILSPEEIAGYKIIPDLYGNDSLILKITKNREIYQQGLKSTFHTIIIILVGGFTMGMGIIILLNHLVIKRMSSIAQQVHAIGEPNATLNRVKIQGNDELSGLANEINQMLDTIELTQGKLKESELQFRDLIENLPDNIVLYGSDKKILYVNPAAISAIGYNAEDLIGKSIFHLVAEECHERIAAFMTARSRGEEIPVYEIKIKTRDGMRRSVIVKGRNAHFNGNPVVFLLLVDITERKEFEIEREHYARELERYSSSLKQANRQINLLTSITRHDILNEINVGLIYLDNLEMDCPDPAIISKLQEIESVIRIIQTQIEFTRLYESLGMNKPEWQDLDMIISTLHVPATILLVKDLKGIEIFADKMLEKVFYNLLENSIRHGQHVSEIRIFARNSGENIILFYEDNGIGIPVQEKEKIFDSGFGKNTGFGMFLVREILFLTGISIKETGVPEKGVRFEILVPKGQYKVLKSFSRDLE